MNHQQRIEYRVVLNAAGKRLSVAECRKVESYRRTWGRAWKARLRQAWEKDEKDETLRSIRNKLGPSGLHRIEFVDFTPE